MREQLAARRYSESSDLSHLGIHYAMQIGVYGDGRIGEVFVQMHKAAGTQADVNARDISILISMALQYGVPIERMLKAITEDENGDPEGLAGAILEHLSGWSPAGIQPVLPETSNAQGPVITSTNAHLLGFTGDECPSCNAFTMVRNGTCLKCETCGATTGCS